MAEYAFTRDGGELLHGTAAHLLGVEAFLGKGHGVLRRLLHAVDEALGDAVDEALGDAVGDAVLRGGRERSIDLLADVLARC
jgi:hypothetical protein